MDFLSQQSRMRILDRDCGSAWLFLSSQILPKVDVARDLCGIFLERWSFSSGRWNMLACALARSDFDVTQLRELIGWQTKECSHSAHLSDGPYVIRLLIGSPRLLTRSSCFLANSFLIGSCLLRTKRWPIYDFDYGVQMSLSIEQ